MSKRAEKKQQDEAKILESLKSGPQTTADLARVLSCTTRTITTKLKPLIADGSVEKLKNGRYCRIGVSSEPQEMVLTNVREEAANQETINRMLNLYDTVLDDIAPTLASELATKATIEEKIDLIKSLRWVAATIDQLMKRWYLVHRGYDTNTRQAVEDAKEKTATRAQQEIENAPPEKQLNVIREYDESMREILENMPHAVKKENTV